MATVKDVAREAGVSVASVSRVMNGATGVSAEVASRVRAAAHALSYRPNGLARSLRTDSSKTIGLVISNIRNPFFTDLARAVEDALAQAGFSLVLCNADEQPAKESQYLQVLQEQRVDGIIISPARGLTPELEGLREQGIPVVLIDRSLSDRRFSYVRSDSRAAIGDLVAHLIRLKHRRFAVIAGPADVTPARQRLAQFTDAAARAGRPVAGDLIVCGDFVEKAGAEAASRLLERGGFDAVFICNNLMTLGALKVFRQRGVRIPQDLAVASFDDPGWYELLSPPLTTIVPPTMKLGEQAAKMVVSLSQGKPVRSRSLPAQLVVRASCGERV